MFCKAHTSGILAEVRVKVISIIIEVMFRYNAFTYRKL